MALSNTIVELAPSSGVSSSPSSVLRPATVLVAGESAEYALLRDAANDGFDTLGLPPEDDLCPSKGRAKFVLAPPTSSNDSDARG